MAKKINILDIIPVITMLVIFAFFAIASNGNTLSLYNIKNLVIQAVPVAIGTLGVIFVVAIGSTDISVGANAALSATIAALVAQYTTPVLMIPLTVVISTGIGAFLGFIITKFNTDSFMTTLASLIALRGLLNFILSKQTISVSSSLLFVTDFEFCIVLLIVLGVIIFFVFEKTKFGYYCKSMGENERTVRSMGINTKRIRLISFIISGCMAGIFGFILLIKVSGASSTLCNMMEMRIQMAIFLGGILVSGGHTAKLYKAILGSFTIVIIENGLTVCKVSSAFSEAVEGILLVVILCITIYSHKYSLKKNDQLLLKAKKEAEKAY